MRDYRIRIKALIECSCYVSANSKKEAAKMFREDPEHQFDAIDSMEKFKITTVEEV